MTLVDRIIYIAGGGVLLLMTLQFAINLVRDPYQDDRFAVVKRIEHGIEAPAESLAPVWAFSQWQEQLRAKPSLWKEIVPAPPPPPPAPKAPAPCPDPCEKLKDVAASRHGIGGKAKILTPENQRGDFMGVGETLNGATIESIDKEFVVFKVFCESQNKDTYCKIPRK